MMSVFFFFFCSSRRRHTRSYGDWSSDVCSSDLGDGAGAQAACHLAKSERLHSERPPIGMSPGALAGLWVAQRDPVRLTDAAGLDGSQSLAETLTSLPQELNRVGEGALRGGALRISLVLFDQVRLKGRRDLVGRLERLIDGPFPRAVVHHAAIIPRGRPSNEPGHRAIPAAMSAPCHNMSSEDARRLSMLKP